MKKILTQAIFILVLAGMFSPEASANFEMSFEIDKKQICVGDEIALKIEILHGSDIKLEPLAEPLNLSPFEVKRVERLALSKSQKGTKEGYRVILTIFELGDFKIPPLEIQFSSKSDAAGKVRTEEIPVKVVSVGRNEKDKDDIRPLKSPVSFAGKFAWKNILFWAALVALAAGAVWAAFRYFPRKPSEDPDMLLSPHERALKRLSALEKKEYIRTGRAKEFFTELSKILERYLIEEFRVISEDLTSSEILARVREKSGFSPDLQGDLRFILGLSDLAKFAKWVPQAVESQSALTKCRNFVETTRPKEKEPEPKAEEIEG